MTTDPRGRWFRVYARMVRQHPKFRDLNAAELGAWLALRSEAELRDGALLTDRLEAILILRRRRCPRSAQMFDRLVELHLFDVNEDGTVHVHDRKDHDRPEYPSDDPEKVRERVKKHRESKANGVSNGSETSGNEIETIAHARAPESGAGADSVSVSDEGVQGESLPDGWDAPDAVVAYNDVTGRWPSEKVIEWLNRMSNDHPEEAIAAELARQYASDSNLGTLLSRTDAALKVDQHRRNKADERARIASQAKAEAPHREREREATPEEREQAALQRQAIRIGLRSGLSVPTEADEVRKFVMKHGAA